MKKYRRRKIISVNERKCRGPDNKNSLVNNRRMNSYVNTINYSTVDKTFYDQHITRYHSSLVQNKIPVLTSQYANRAYKHLKQPFKRNNSGVNFDFIKGNSPEAMKMHVRKQQIVKKRVEREEDMVKRQYVIHHPVLKLLEGNAKKIAAHEIFLNDDGFSNLKRLCIPKAKSTLESRNDIVFLNLKQKANKAYSTFLL